MFYFKWFLIGFFFFKWEIIIATKNIVTFSIEAHGKQAAVMLRQQKTTRKLLAKYSHSYSPITKDDSITNRICEYS